jgi:ABC-type taurine transport system ATPase subunit
MTGLRGWSKERLIPFQVEKTAAGHGGLLAMEPQTIILDEPTDSLDLEGRTKFWV